ncbi:hypothetical protein AAFF_G00080280 [Aldrovandia affinis]|uniref:Uncharacterized protein n=1 Tax=Aldrovandia affinis TaxID=143900 RepID=A0AAD7T360_9TELE|nr:hypothetical protein AAFF_G00080280 [Aldrovandia affinis]
MGFRSTAQEPYHQRMKVAAYALPTMPSAQDAPRWQSQPIHEETALLPHHGGLQLFSYGSADVALRAFISDVSGLSEKEEETEGHNRGPQDPLFPLKQQIFLALLSSQYQARPDMVWLIASLDIRFVYFSAAEEVKSKSRGLPTPNLDPQDNTTIIRFMKQALHTTAGIRKCFLFLLQCQLSPVPIQCGPPGQAFRQLHYEGANWENLRFLPKTHRFFVFCFLVKFGLTDCTCLT